MNSSSTKIHHKASFSWEKYPGIWKFPSDQKENFKTTHHDNMKLPPPPVPAGSPKSLTGPKGARYQYVPLPPCHFNPPLIALRKDERDPFLAAYIVCTKSKKSRKISTLFGKLSCKQRSVVREDAMIRISN